ncbi:hypothetical protein PsorP6_006513 [Peronosclerospora sorghi]|uniref:Uncharacterized protein n=1 Tax=Peronosclerospora sorghi TaxID=230839 RepID=A0ACC0W1X1_9STRA|nr:hypothetical protein PsorP6_006513 [Peronosclerospora sorghi]
MRTVQKLDLMLTAAIPLKANGQILEVPYWKEQVKTNRYLKRNSVARAPNVFDFHMNQLDEPLFKQEFRMSKGAFVQIVSLIQDNHVFHNSSRNPQRPVKEQLMVTLKRFGCFGNGVSVGILAKFFVSPKEPLNCTQIGKILLEYTLLLCFFGSTADNWSSKSDVIFWPDADERNQIAQRIKKASGFTYCTGFVDGTLFLG